MLSFRHAASAATPRVNGAPPSSASSAITGTGQNALAKYGLMEGGGNPLRHKEYHLLFRKT
eukprot:6570570-Prorocentrum_lima.AAC.1